MNTSNHHNGLIVDAETVKTFLKDIDDGRQIKVNHHSVKEEALIVKSLFFLCK